MTDYEEKRDAAAEKDDMFRLTDGGADQFRAGADWARDYFTRWRDAEKEKPEKPGEYLVYRVKHPVTGAWSHSPITVRIWNGAVWQSGMVVKYWLPLPPLPTIEGEVE